MPSKSKCILVEKICGFDSATVGGYDDFDLEQIFHSLSVDHLSIAGFKGRLTMVSFCFF